MKTSPLNVIFIYSCVGHTWIITIKHTIQSHFSHIDLLHVVGRVIISVLQGFVSSFTQCYAMSITFVVSKYRYHIIRITFYLQRLSYSKLMTSDTFNHYQ